MTESIALIAQAVAIISACWAIVSGVGAWKREFVGKRRIELAEEALSCFFEIKDAIATIRSPVSYGDEGSTRKKREHETKEETEILNRAFVVFERYELKKEVFIRFNTVKYRFMAAFGPETENIFIECNVILSRIFSSARFLGTHYWRNHGKPGQGVNFIESMNKYENIFWDSTDEDDEIRKKLKELQIKLDLIVKPCFEEPFKTYAIFTKSWFEKVCKYIEENVHPSVSI